MGLVDTITSWFNSGTPAVQAAPRVARYDGWANAALGYGTSRDRALGTGFCNGPLISDGELASLFYHEPMAKKVVTKRLSDAFRRGYELGEGAPKDLVKKTKTLNYKRKFIEAWTWGALYGGALLIFWDGTDPSKPLPEGAQIKTLTILDRRFLRLEQWMYESDMSSPDFGTPKYYGLSPSGQPSDPRTVTGYIHASRVIHMRGALTDDYERMARLAGWDYSVLQAPYEALSAFGLSFKSAGALLQDMSQGVFKIENLISMISGDPETLQTRMAMLDQNRSSGRAIMLDAAGEEFTRVATPLTGVADVMDRVFSLVAAAFDMPITILLGRSPAGMNATGESDTRGYYDSVASMQTDDIQPPFVRGLQLIAGGESAYNGEDFEWCELWEPTEQEQATTDKLKADTYKVYIDAQVLLPEEVKLAEFGDEKIVVDVASLKADIKASNDRMKEMAATTHEATVATQTAMAEGATAAQEGEQEGEPSDPPAAPSATE